MTDKIRSMGKPGDKLVTLLLALCLLAVSITVGMVERSIMATVEDDGVRVPIIMYHSILKSAKVQTKYIVTPAQLEQDMLWLKNNGYTTVFIEDLINYVYDGVDLPPKPVVLTFDDGYYNNLTYLYPLLKKHGMKATVSIVGKYSEEFSQTLDLNPSYAHLTWDNLKQMDESGLVEVLNHSYNMHSDAVRKGCKIMKGENVAEYKKVFSDDVMMTQELLSKNCGITPMTFTYPYGYICSESEEVLRSLGFKASLSCYEMVNILTRDPQCLYSLKRFNRDSTLSTQGFMKRIK